MWLVTTIGFFSVVQKSGEQHLTVRARVCQDLDRLRERYLPSLSATKATPGNDYPFRATVSHEDLAQALGKMARDISYSNFKNQVAKELGAQREAVCHGVWHELRALQSTPEAKQSRSKPGAKSAPSGRANAFGIVLIDEEGRVLLREPKNHKYGYVWTFAKGKKKPGESAQQAARREVLEETGFAAEIDGELAREFEGQTGATKFFVSRRFKQAQGFDDETESVRWATVEEAKALVAQNTDATAKKRDRQVVDAIEEYLAARL
jgi:8-oxo-dGTP pyrophosphatase MutT (NUDIX family)